MCMVPSWVGTVHFTIALIVSFYVVTGMHFNNNFTSRITKHTYL